MSGFLSRLFKVQTVEPSDGPTPFRFNSWERWGGGADLFEKSAEALELERMNPLRGVDEWRLGQIFDDARDGVFADLAWLYNEIEGVEPALFACREARDGALSELGWVVRTADADRTRGFDQALADDERAALLAEFGAVSDDIPDLAAHMAGAFFRGAAHALPLWNGDGSLAGFRPLDLWNFALDRGTGLWHWNADASRDESSFQPVPPGALVTLAVSSARHVDHAALPIFIRAALGAKRYGVWLDRFGIPPVAVIMPASAERGEQPAYMDLARKFARGGSGVLPNGSSVAYGTEARSVCPFPEFIRFQQQQIYALGLGRVQSAETQGENLGGNAAGVVGEAFRRLVRRDARRVARAVNDCATRRILARLFPGRPALAAFDFDTDARPTGREALQDAGLARAAGLSIDRAQLEEMTGYTLAAAPGGEVPGSQFPVPGSVPPPFPQDRRNAIANPLQNARKGAEVHLPPPAGETRQNARESISALSEAFARDLGPAAGELKKLLDLPDDQLADGARELMGRLDDLLPADPETAAVLAEEMAKAFAEGAGQTISLIGGAANKSPAGGESGTRKAGAEAALANSAGECRAKDPAHCPVHGTPASSAAPDPSGAEKGEGGKKDGAPEAAPNPATPEDVEKFKRDLPKDIEPEQFDALLTAGFTDTDGDGNAVRYGTLLRDHVNATSRNEQDRDARKKRLGVAVRMVRSAKPQPTGVAKPNERVYIGAVDGKAYIAVADEHNEIGAIEMVSYRRDGRKDRQDA